ncbi:MAG TPA: hypothetical protein VN493_21875 [Thermoanaerobaculia bacterium]|nr:hypothetical protein [Thermoanaerobaculia bacterium]
MRTAVRKSLSAAILCLLVLASAAFAGELEPFTSDLVVTRTNESGQPVTTTSRFYRDSEGRTRTEEGNLVTITDPVAGKTIHLFPTERTYMEQSWAGGPPQQGRMSPPEPLQKTESSLGSRSTEGWVTEGRRYSISRPGGKAAVTREVTVWLSQDLKIPIGVEIQDPVNGPWSQRYTNIAAGSEPERALFQAPASYVLVVQPPPTQVRRCNLRINPDPLILNSFGPVLGRGMQVASTSANRGCVFVDGLVYVEYPLEFIQLTPLFFPSFSARWRDNGGLLPYVPYVAFGDLILVAANNDDTTTKDGLMILTVWF